MLSNNWLLRFGWMNGTYLFLASTWNFFYKIIKNCSKAPHLSIKFLSKALCCSKLKTFHTCNLLSHWALSNYCNPLWDTFHIPMIKITYTSPLTCYTSTLEDSKHFHPSQNKTPNHSMTLSLSKVTIKDMGYTKRNKRCIPNEGMPHAHKACKKKKNEKKWKEEKEKDSPYLEK